MGESIHAKMPRLCANESASLREALGRRKELPEFAAVGDDILNKLEIVIHVGTLFGRPTALWIFCDFPQAEVLEHGLHTRR